MIPNGAPRHVRRLGVWAAKQLIQILSQVLPKDRSSVLVYGLTPSDDGVLAVQAALIERGYSPVRLVDPGFNPRTAQPGLSYVPKHSLRGAWALARAFTVFTSHALYRGLALGRRQRLVLLWHGEVVKPVGRLDGDRPVPADLAPVCSQLGQAYRVAEFDLRPDQIPIVGAPRNDRLLSADFAQVRSRLGWPLERPTWLWLPTYRQSVRGGLRSDTEPSPSGLPFTAESLARLDGLLTERGIEVVIKPHPLAVQSIPDGYRSLTILTQDALDQSTVSLYEYLAAADGLITDVSSVWIDFLLRDRPMIFAFPDLAQYRSNRGFNLEPYEDWVPGPVVSDVEALADHLARSADGRDDYVEQRQVMHRRLHRHSDAASSDRLLNTLGM
jgi:CDP-glycerol glycerophosphotransferase